MKKEIKEIEKNLKATLSGFKDAKEMYGYDLANETYYVKEALKQVKLLNLHGVSGSVLPSLLEDLKGFETMGFLPKDVKTGLGIAIEQVERYMRNELEAR